MISQFQTLVANFNKRIGQRLGENGFDLPKMLALRISLIDEEVKETAEAMKNSDPILTIDGLCDVLYVTYGAADVFDIELDTLRAEEKPPTGKVDWVEISEDDFLHRAQQAMGAIKNHDLETMKAQLQGLAEGCWECATQGLGVDLRPFFREVHRTNMWKLKGPKREDGKQLKPSDWSPPRLAAMYNRLKVGNPPACVHVEEGVAVAAYPHPQGGHFCQFCGGLFVDWMEVQPISLAEEGLNNIGAPCSVPIASQLQKIQELKAGWFNGEGNGYANSFLTRLQSILESVVTSYDLPCPYIYPTPTGEVLVEWTSSKWIIDLLFDAELEKVEIVGTEIEGEGEMEKTIAVDDTLDKELGDSIASLIVDWMEV